MGQADRQGSENTNPKEIFKQTYCYKKKGWKEKIVRYPAEEIGDERWKIEIQNTEMKQARPVRTRFCFLILFGGVDQT